MDDLSEDQYHRLRVIAAAIVIRLRPLFREYSELSTDDLIHIAICGTSDGSLGGAIRAHRHYDGKGAYSSWIGRACHSALLDHRNKLGTRERGLQRHLTQPEHRFIETKFTNDGPNNEYENSEIPGFIPAKLNRERGAALNARAYASAFLYREQEGLSWWGLWAKLRSDTRLRSSMGFSRPPARSSFFLAKRRFAKFGRAIGIL